VERQRISGLIVAQYVGRPRRKLADNIKLYLREIWREDVDGFVWFTCGTLMGFCEQGNELPVFINDLEFVDKLSSVAPCRLVTLLKAVLLRAVCAVTLQSAVRPERSSK
jgi:hypothetical protein